MKLPEKYMSKKSSFKKSSFDFLGSLYHILKSLHTQKKEKSEISLQDFLDKENTPPSRKGISEYTNIKLTDLFSLFGPVSCPQERTIDSVYEELRQERNAYPSYQELYQRLGETQEFTVEQQKNFAYYHISQIVESCLENEIYIFDDIKEKVNKDWGFIKNIDKLIHYIRDFYLNRDEKTRYLVDQKKVDADLIQLSTGECIADGSFLYSWTLSKTDNGIKKFQEASNSPLYQKFKIIEKNIYKFLFTTSKLNPQIRALLDECDSFVDLGTGGSSKLEDYTRYIADAKIGYEYNNRIEEDVLQEYKHNTYMREEWYKRFIQSKKIGLVDVSSQGFSVVKQELQKKFNSSIKGLEDNFFMSDSPAYTFESPVYFMFGGTIGNFKDQEVNTILNNMRSKEIVKRSSAFFTYYSTPDKNILSEKDYQLEIDKIKAAYGDDERNPYYDTNTYKSKKDFYLSGFESLGFNREDLEYIVEYEEGLNNNPDRIKVGVEVKNDISFTMHNGNTFSKQKGDKMWAIQSKRFKRGDREKIAKDNNYTIVANESADGVGVCILQSSIGLINKYKDFNRSTIGKNIKIHTIAQLSIFTLLGSIVSTVDYIEKKNATNKNHQQELLEKKNYTPYQELSGFKGFEHQSIKIQSDKLIKQIEGTLVGDQKINNALIDLHKQGYDISYNIFGTSKKTELYIIATFLQKYITDPKQKEELKKYDLSQKIEEIIGYHVNLGGIKLQKGTIEYNKIYGSVFNQMSFYGEANERITDDERIKLTHDKFWEFKPVKDK